MVDKIAVIWALKEMQFPYWCIEHKRVHKYGTKVWERDLDYVDIDKLPTDVKKLAFLKRKQHYIKMKEVESKHDITVVKHLRQEFEKRKNKPVYFAFEIIGYFDTSTFRQVGDRDGYSTLQKLEEDRDLRYKIDSAKRGRS